MAIMTLLVFFFSLCWSLLGIGGLLYYSIQSPFPFATWDAVVLFSFFLGGGGKGREGEEVCEKKAQFCSEG